MMEPTTDLQFIIKIISQALEDGSLEIPRASAEENGMHNLKCICLEASPDKIWKVELRKGDGRVWLDKGWTAFADSYAIKTGYSLLFRSEGGSLFKVFIFDASGVPIKCSNVSVDTNQRVTLDHPRVTKVKEEDSDDDSSLFIYEECPPQAFAGNDSSNDEVLQGKDLASSSAREGALQRARTFVSRHPHFFVIMPETCHSYLLIPDCPTRSYFQGRDEGDIYLSGPDGEAWHMKSFIEGPPMCQVRISFGWSEFAQKYLLQEGDVCIFELFDTRVMAFNVTIFRKEEEMEESDRVEMPDTPAPTKTVTSQLSNSAVLERAKNLECLNPSFTYVHRVTIYAKYSLVVPASHAVYLSSQHKKEVILHGLDGKNWPVKCYAPAANLRLSTGWSDFVKDNNLQAGDTCKFELFSQAPNHYAVTIVRAAELAKPNSPTVTD